MTAFVDLSKTHEKCASIAGNEFSGLHETVAYTSPARNQHHCVSDEGSDEFGNRLQIRYDRVSGSERHVSLRLLLPGS